MDVVRGERPEVREAQAREAREEERPQRLALGEVELLGAFPEAGVQLFELVYFQELAAVADLLERKVPHGVAAHLAPAEQFPDEHPKYGKRAVDAAGAVLARVHEVDVAEDERLGDVAAFRRGPVHLQLAQVGEVCVVGEFRQRARLGFHNRTRLGVKVAHWLPLMAYMRSKAIV